MQKQLKGKIKKLEIDLLEDASEENYRRARAKYIGEYEEYKVGGFLSAGGYEKNPVVGEAEWNKEYPDGFDDWEANQKILTSIGQQMVIDKINELVEISNKKLK